MHLSTDIRKFVSLRDEQTIRTIRDADLFLFRRRGLISIAGRGVHSHAAKAAWWGDDLFCLEVREFVGGRAVTLASQVNKFPNAIDVFETNPYGIAGYDRDGATRYMRKLCGQPYGYASIFWASLTHLPFVRLCTTVPLEDTGDMPDAPPNCSAACARSDQWGGGYDPVPNLASHMTEPADLARSNFYKYKFSLVV